MTCNRILAVLCVVAVVPTTSCSDGDTAGSAGKASDTPSCTDECEPARARKCEGDEVMFCADHDADGCVEWAVESTCAAGTCVGGYCSMPCEDACSVAGARQCDGDGIQFCEDEDADGCLAWTSAVACDAGESCSNGFCASACADECTVYGAQRCDPSGVQVCGNTDSDACLEWGSPTACPTDQVCSKGFCAADCADACTVVGAQQCDPSGVQVCGDTDADPCLEWGTPTACPQGQACASGHCAADCTDECTVVRAQQCDPAGVQVCGDTGTDPCLEWGTPVACSPGLVCSNGFCDTACTDECTVAGAQQCDPSGVQVCGDTDSDACLEWGTPTPCSAGQVCASGHCAADCTDECTIAGAQQCDPGGAQVCGDTDSDTCLEWGTPTACPVGQVCASGHCAADCTDECTAAGALQCDPSGVQVCGDTDNDPCLEWGTPTACPVGQVCASGHCAADCTDECTVDGAKQCDPAGVQVCSDTDTDPCLEWGTPSACGSGETCSNGHCSSTCTSECTVVGAKQCDPTGVQVCGNADGDACLEWGTPTACPAGQACASGHCADECTDECTVEGAKQCDPAGVQVCGNTDADPCLEWGTPTACGADETCSNGHCSSTCTSECTVVGAKQCDPAGAHVCGNTDSDVCLEWGTPVACPAGQVCASGHCADDCTDDCTAAGARQCDPAGVQICDNSDGDACLEWGTPTACPVGQVCAGGHCADDCTDECTVAAAKQCDPAGVQVCGNTDSDVCLEWGTPVACPAGQVCASGHCADECTDECTVEGAKQCDPAGVQVCGNTDADPCLEWGTPTACGADETCSNGHCSSTCTSECTVAGAKQCDPAGPQVCGNTDSDVCLEWGTPVACPAGQVCASGHCADDCTDDCTAAGARQCDPAGVQICGNSDGDACLEWGTPTACPVGQVCAGGHCADDCTSECTVVGAKQCDPAGVQVCGNTDSDVCLEWGTPVACPAGQVCAGGHCADDCTDDCTVEGAQQCDPAGVQVCGDTDTDPCLEWGTPTACGADETCSNGHCSSTCTSECTVVGAKQCDPGGVQVCGNTDSDVCLEWGTAVACPPGQSCSNGHCATTCVDACSPADARACNVASTAVVICGDYNGDGCLEWGSDVACAAEQVCTNGVCGQSCWSGCAVANETQCDGFNNVQTCGDYNTDGCLEWGTPVACAVTEACQNGVCELVARPFDLVINEVLYDDTGSDENAFVELFGQPGGDLTGFVLTGYSGTNGLSYASIDLSGQQVGADGFFVIISDTTVDAGLIAEADMTSLDADFYNGPDNLVLHWGSATVDAVGYGDFSSSVFLGEGSAAQDVAEGSTLGRDAAGTDTDDNAADFHGFATWTPGADNGAGNLPPVAALSCPATATSQEPVLLDGTGSTDDMGIVDWSFEFGDQTTQSGTVATATHVFQTTDDFTVTLTVRDGLGATDQASCVVTILDPAAPSVVIIEPLQNIQVTQGTVVPVAVDATPYTGRAITQVELWVDGVPSGLVDTVAPYTFVYTVPAAALTGSTIVIVAVADDDQGAVGISAPRELYVQNDDPVATFSAIITGNLEVGVDASGCTDTETAAAALEVRWDWENDGAWDTPYSTTKTASFTYAVDGSYTIAVEVKDGVGQTTTTTRTVDFQSEITVSGDISTTLWYGTVNVSGDVRIPAGETLTIAAGTTVAVVEMDQLGDGVGDYEIAVDGTLLVQGTAAEPVTFTTLPTLPAAAPVADPSSWDRLQLNSSGNVIEHAVIEYADAGLVIIGGDASVDDTEFRFNRVGLSVNGGGSLLSSAGLVARDNSEAGVRIWGSSLNATGPVIQNNSGEGLFSQNALAVTLSSCLIDGNTNHGLQLRNSVIDISGCTISNNGATGAALEGSTTGTMTQNQIQTNAFEGVRAIMKGGLNPSPQIRYNNIVNNGASGSLVYVPVNLSVTSPGAGGGDVNTPTWSTPTGHPVLIAKVSYSETTSHADLTGYLQSGGGTNLVTYATPVTNKWEDISASNVASIRGRVYDWIGGPSATFTIHDAAYVGAGPAKQLVVVVNSGTVDARYNYFGVWPDVQSAVDFVTPSNLDIQGFVGTPYDPTWDPRPYWGGIQITSDTLWDTDVFVTGNISIAAGITLTVAEGVQVAFAPTDQDGDQVGDWSIQRGAGTLNMVGTVGNPVTVTVLGTMPTGGGFQYVGGTGAGSSTLTETIIEKGATNYYATNGTTTLTNVILRDAVLNGLYLQSASASLDADYLTSTNNGLWGVSLVNATAATNQVSNSTLNNNVQGGVSARDSVISVTQSHVKFNGYGLWLEGNSSGTISANDILFNNQEGVVALWDGGQVPTSQVTGNNIYQNAVVDALYQDDITRSATSPDGGGDVYTAPWSSGGLQIFYAKTSYSETTNHANLTGYLQSGGGTDLVTYETPVSNTWNCLLTTKPTSVRGKVYDWLGGQTATISLHDVVYRLSTTDLPRNTELSVGFIGSFTATGNYWGVFPGVATRIFEIGAGTTDYTGFQSVPITGTGPQ